MSDKMELYKTAIEGYQSHWEHYNHWMNMYAIFNGALFVGLYTLGQTADFVLKLAILLLGCISSWFWLFSARGFYRWIISWINVVKKQEKLLETELVKSGNNEQNQQFKAEDTYIYRAFIFGKKKSPFTYTPFSTQKLTQWFSGSVAVIWSGITIYSLWKEFKIFQNICPILYVIFGAIVLAIILLCFISTCRETPLNETHHVFCPKGKDEFELD